MGPANTRSIISVVAGYPWFGDWGRDTMIALPGLTLATGRHESARRILETFARFVNPATGTLFDVLDGPRGHDDSLRPKGP